MEEIRYSVPDVHCPHCERAIATEVAAVPGVAGVEVNLEARVVAVRGDHLDEGAVRAAIVAAGYEPL